MTPATTTTPEQSLDDLLRRGLDWVARLAPYDLATIFTVKDQALVVRAARGKLAGKVREHSLALADFPTLREACLLYTSPSPRDRTRSRMPSSA